MQSPVTFVTAFVDLGRLEDRKERTWDFYRDNARWLFNLGLPMVAYLEPDHLQEMRDLYPTSPVDWRELDVVSMMKKVEAVQSVLDRHPREWKASARYFCMAKQKTSLLHEAACVNPFQSTHFYWIDFGIAYVPNFPTADSEEVLRQIHKDPWLKRGVTVCAIDYIPPTVLANRDKYYGSNWWPMASGFFGGPKQSVAWLADSFDWEWSKVVSEGHIPYDERIHGWLMDRHPERYTRHFGDHCSCVANCFGAKHSIDLVTYMSSRARYFGAAHEADIRFNEAKLFMSPQYWRCSTV